MSYGATDLMMGDMSTSKLDEDHGCLARLKSEFKPRNFFLTHEYPGLFGRAQCASGPSVIYLLWRFIWPFYHISIIATSGVLNRHYASSEENRRKWPIFMTNWALSTLTISAIIDMIVAFYMYFNHKNLLQGEKGPMAWYLKTLWVVMNAANSMGVIVSVVWWFALYDYSEGIAGYKVLPFLTHGVNVMYIFVNLMVVAMPVRLLHFFHAAIIYTTYIIFNAIYVLAGGTNDVDKPYIYPILDWNNNPARATGIAVSGIVGACFAHVIVFTFYFIKMSVFTCVSRRV